MRKQWWSMGLSEYRRKRHFGRTPEPSGKKASAKGHSFVVQKHRARNLHYDFRLEMDGVLKSWAVPKGPSLDPSVKRLAMEVEDHPVEYGAFEGVIPEGEYGGGTVMLWDRGSWEPIGDAQIGYDSGRLKFKLRGRKLRGGWMLVRTGSESPLHPETRRWLLFKERDDKARAVQQGNVLEDQPASVATGRSLDEIAADRDWVWNSKQESGVRGQGPGFRNKASTASGQKARTATRTKRRPTARGIEYDFGKEEFAGVRLTHPSKVLYPEQGITKLELAEYYLAVGEWILPHLVGRPLVLVRCPEGRGKGCFYQKHPPAGTSDSLRQVTIREKHKAEPYVIADDVKGLISLTQIGALEIHAWGSRADKLEKPDRLIFDLDPDVSVAWSAVVQCAVRVREFLQELGLESFVKTTGGKGLHLVVPIDRRYDWDESKVFCESVAELIVRADPTHFTANMAKAARSGKIYVDYLRNVRGATAIVPYSTRARDPARRSPLP